uniref:Uncharacterized protein n=1 Tax=Anguilla anguilla TaxID=7936 RepID=A0A0E9VBR6_ANGAN
MDIISQNEFGSGLANHQFH